MFLENLFNFAAAETVSRDAEDGFAPRVLERRLPNGAPALALAVALIISYAALLALYFALGRNEAKLGGVLISAALSASILSCVAQLACFLKLRVSDAPPGIAPPADRSWLGIPGAVAAAAISMASLGSIVLLSVDDPTYAYGLALVGLVAVTWFAAHWFISTSWCSRPLAGRDAAKESQQAHEQVIISVCGA